MSDPRVFAGPDDTDYLGWLRAHPKGRVVNGLADHARVLHRDYPDSAVLHLATCGSIGDKGTRKGQVKSHTGVHEKACWESWSEFDEWRNGPNALPVVPSCPECGGFADKP